MKYLVDSDFLFGLFVVHDPHHQESVFLLKKIYRSKAELIALNLVIQETATVLSYKDKQSTALEFIERIAKMPIKILNLDADIEKSAWSVFQKQIKKGTSFVDCANLAVYQKFNFDGIVSFDNFYPKKVRMN